MPLNILNTPGTYNITVPSGTTRLDVPQCIGGGNTGGAGSSRAAGSGGSGSYCGSKVGPGIGISVSAGQVVTFVVATANASSVVTYNGTNYIVSYAGGTTLVDGGVSHGGGQGGPAVRGGGGGGGGGSDNGGGGNGVNSVPPNGGAGGASLIGYPGGDGGNGGSTGQVPGGGGGGGPSASSSTIPGRHGAGGQIVYEWISGAVGQVWPYLDGELSGGFNDDMGVGN